MTMLAKHGFATAALALVAANSVSAATCRKWCGNQEDVRFLIKVESL